MESDEHKTFTTIARQARAGSAEAQSALMDLVYEELRRVAQGKIKNMGAPDLLQPTALVNEAYLRLVEKGQDEWENRRHFFSLAARAMRDIVVEEARRQAAAKRGGGQRRISLEEADIATRTDAWNLIDLNDALDRLKATDSLASEIVMLRYFAGLSHEQTAEVLEIKVSKVRREWDYAKSFLYAELGEMRSE